MKSSVLIACVLLSIGAQAQQFSNVFSVSLPDSAITAKVEWVDLNNDGWLDVFVFAESASGDNFFVTCKSNPESGPKNPIAHASGFRDATYRLADFDWDGDIDIIVSGMFSTAPRTSFFENQGEFKFAEQSSIPFAGSIIHFADLNSNGNAELILSGHDNNDGPFFRIYQFGTTWKLIHDSLKIEATSIQVFDFDGDSDNDIFVSGSENTNNVSRFLYNHGGLYFQPVSATKAGKGLTSIGDLNHDGRLDIFLTGVNTSGQNVSVQYLNEGHSFSAKDTLAALSKSIPFLADFNSDGKCDIQVLGNNGAGDTLNTIALRDSVSLILNNSKLHHQAFGDYDRDGDLDLIQVVKNSNAFQLITWRNDPLASNRGPSAPMGSFGFTIFNKLFVYWNRAMHDRTPSKAITYDVMLQSVNAEILVGEFDVFRNKRLTVSHGNTGTRNYLILKPRAVAPFTYAVQSIDNSFQTPADPIPGGPPGLCLGTAVPCDTQEIVRVDACKNETLTFTAKGQVNWFSLSKGFLAEGVSYETKAEVADTIFSFSQHEGCNSLKVYLIEIRKNFLRKTADTKFVCEGQTIPLSVKSDWSTVRWRSFTQGELGTTSSITYTAFKSDTVTVTASNDESCGIQNKTTVTISKPVIQLEAEIIQILKGETVQLNASGGETYRWTPEESLDNSAIANPVASPVSTTDYTVTATDSIGCSATSTVKVIVEGNAFIPNLFTPNDDGKNDEVKVYGLSTVANFSFVIHNREGNVLYETKDVKQVSASGWDGTSRGVKQPAGVYYWKVKGEYPGGSKLLLNGKTTGSIVLIR